MTASVDNIHFVTETCCKCHMPFSMTKAFHDARRQDRQSFCCPAGHSQHYTGESEESKLRRQLERERSIAEAAQIRALTAQHQRDEIQRAHKKMRTRVMNGVCPCCNRTFQNLMRHMQSEHASEMTLKNLRTAFGMTQAAVASEAGVAGAYISLHEREKPVPEYAKHAIESWIEKHGSKV